MIDFRFTTRALECLEAIVERLIPADLEWTGARDAGVATFIERQLAGPYGRAQRWYRETKPDLAATDTFVTPMALYIEGLAETDRLCLAESGRRFASREAPDQDAFSQRMDSEALRSGGPPMKPFFELVLENTIEGYFSDPRYGGNKEAASWRMLGFPGCGHDYRTMLTTHRNRTIDLPIQTVERLRKSLAK